MSEGDTDFTIGRSNHDVQTESRDSMTYRGTSSDNTSNPTQIKYPQVDQVDVHTLEENFVSTVRSEVDNVMITVETRVKDAALTAIEKLGIPRV